MLNSTTGMEFGCNSMTPVSLMVLWSEYTIKILQLYYYWHMDNTIKHVVLNLLFACLVWYYLPIILSQQYKSSLINQQALSYYLREKKKKNCKVQSSVYNQERDRISGQKLQPPMSKRLDWNLEGWVPKKYFLLIVRRINCDSKRFVILSATIYPSSSPTQYPHIHPRRPGARVNDGVWTGWVSW